MKHLKAMGRKLIKGAGHPYSHSPDGFIPSMAVERFLADKNRILLVGDATGRDYALLTYRGKEIFVLDIVHQNIPNFYQQSITTKTPFVDKFFDGVVLADVLEHLFEDYLALNEIHRILKDDGVLVVTVPYLSHGQDEERSHVRVHTRKTIERLLAWCGFRIEEHFYRGLISRLPQRLLTRYVGYAPAVTLKILFGDRGLEYYRRGCFFLEQWVGSTPILSDIQKTFTSYGGIMKTIKGQRINFTEIQTDTFSGQWVHTGEIAQAGREGNRA